jgi:hypothetical protein
LEKNMSKTFPNGLTVRELKQLIKDWPEVDERTGEARKVWVDIGEEVSSPARSVWELNVREDNGVRSADILLSIGE